MSVRGDRLAAYHVRRGRRILLILMLGALLWLIPRIVAFVFGSPR